MKYRRKRTVEAFQYDGDLMNSHGEYYVPSWAVNAYENGVLGFNGPDLVIRDETMDKEAVVPVGSYLVRCEGGICSYAKDIFERLYEPIKEEK